MRLSNTLQVLTLAAVAGSSSTTSAFVVSPSVAGGGASLLSSATRAPLHYSASTTARTAAASSSGNDNSNNDIYVMVNGMPGPMALAAAEACLRKGLQLAPVCMTGPSSASSDKIITVTDSVTKRSADVRLVPCTDTKELESSIAGLKEAVGGDDDGAVSLLAIDYTHPSAVNDNGRFYVKNGIPFVMGTTGGDRDQLLSDCEGHCCVIAPNMGKQIVAMQAALQDLATKYPAAFEGYTLKVRESHQVTKADTSGTAKAVISSIKTLSANDDFTSDDIEMIRNEDEAIDFGVPADALKGHAFHTYTLTSPDGTVGFELQHNVAGRTVYAEGTADAVKFLAKKLKSGEPCAKIYTMVNVLEEGALE